ncbi:hypothetical protein CASFOL_016679 [Castilleja foliolosa]|uniref:Uncharacterized protein n=1 Tax=Castilleja foliolosa TaxID=1961234 RepID=A0ABD3D9T9_9LAMI
MERTEPALVPEWLRCSGNVAGGGASVHHSDVSSPAHSSRSRYFRSNSEKDNNSTRYQDRNSLSNPRRTSSSISNNNGSPKHPYSSFSRSRWDKDKNREREKEKSLSGDMWDNDPLSSILTNSAEKIGLRRSQSLVSRKPGEPLPRRVDDSRTQKAVFEKDFPSLGAEENQGVTGIKRVLSPVLSLPIGNSGFLGGEKWTSALVEVPPIINSNSNGMGHQPSIPQSVGMVSNSSSGVSSTVCLNMAEALSQPAAHSITQQPDKSQRLEELAIKQSRQLIPMTPSMSKPLVPNSVDKSKQPKVGIRTNEATMVSRGVHPKPHSTHLSNQSRSGQIKPDSASTSHIGKFLVLKPGAKDGFSSDTTNGRVNTDGQHPSAPPTPIASMSLSNSVVSALENNAAALSISSKMKPNVDKKSAQSLVAQSRSEFFNLMRRKASTSVSTVRSGPSLDGLPTIPETSAEKFKEGHADMSARVLENGSQCNGDGYDSPGNKRISEVEDNSLSDNGSIYPDEEEAAFLRSLGWDENGGEDEGLTEEEINAFYQEYMNRRPSSTLPTLSATSGVSNSESETEA